MLVVAVAGTLMAIAVPVTLDVTATIKLNEAARMIEREFQEARLRAVSSNRSLRVRTNCPSVGLVRTVEVLGDSRDSATDRCQTTGGYPFPSDPDNEVSTRPNHDGAVRPVPNSATVGSVVYEFQPNGMVFNVVSNVATRMSAEQTVTISRGAMSRTVRVNGAGKIQLQ